ncbi:MAG: hypothetical protein L0Z52_00935, partial [Acidobacteria bacterium]|nr:hypothetical protein [Acidobacteriota bacterium]
VVDATGSNAEGNYLAVVSSTVPVQNCSVSVSGPSGGLAGTILCFNAITSGGSGSYLWSASGGAPSSGTGPTFCTSFTAAGSYQVSVSYMMAIPGCSSADCGTASRIVSITEPPPTVAINSPNPTNILVGQTPTITATGRDGFGNPTSGTYSWSTSDASVLAISPNAGQVQLQGVAPGSATLSVSFQTPAGTATGQIGVNVVKIDTVTATGATKISQIIGNENILHFVSPKGQAGEFVTLDASITPNNPTVQASIDWEGATEDPTNPLQAKVPKAAAGKTVVRVKLNSVSGKEARVWIIWATGTATKTGPVRIVRGQVSDNHNPQQIGPAAGIQVNWGEETTPLTIGFEFVVSPASVLTDEDRPNFAGGNLTPPPCGACAHILNGFALSAGATLKLDMSRRWRVRILSPTVGVEWYERVPGSIFDNLPAANVVPVDFPTQEAEGNDDASIDGEENVPTSSGQLRAIDQPGGYFLRDAGGSVGDTVEMRWHFGEFLRLELEGVWTRVSDFLDWRLHTKLRKADEAVDNQDYNNDGDTLDQLWIDAGSVSDATNNGWN